MPKISAKIIFLSFVFLAGFFILTGLVFKNSLQSFILQFIFTREINLEKHDSRVNLLLLGTAGGEHDGPDLTDTLILVSLDPVRNQVVLISIPRDLYLTDLNGKINTAYTLGKEKKSGGGLVLARAAVSKITGQQIDYALEMNFAGFVQAVDLVGGIDVSVENTFDDWEYPITGLENDLCGKSQEEAQSLATSSAKHQDQELFPCRFEHLHFDKGPQIMNGETALKFVRSRNAEGEEGTDFARSRRQQKVMVAFKDKILTAQTLLNPVKIISLYKVLAKNIETDIQMSKLDDFIRLAQKMKDAKIRNAVLDDGDPQKGIPGLLVNPSLGLYGGAWVLIPRTGEDNFTEIQEFVRCEIESGDCPIK